MQHDQGRVCPVMAENEEHMSADQVKQYIEAILVEKDRALEKAADEREKAAVVLRNEQGRALDQADSERQQAARNLKDELARAINEGDDRLREHISQQFQQINAALISSEKLEIERFARAEHGLVALAEKLDVLRHASEVEMTKFEESVKARFVQVNEFRGSLDDLSKQMATRRELEALAVTLHSKMDDSIVQRNLKFDEINKSLQSIRSRLDTGPAQLANELRELQTGAATTQGQQQGQRQSQATLYGLIAAVGGVLGIVIVLSNFLSAH